MAITKEALAKVLADQRRARKSERRKFKGPRQYRAVVWFTESPTDPTVRPQAKELLFTAVSRKDASDRAYDEVQAFLKTVPHAAHMNDYYAPIPAGHVARSDSASRALDEAVTVVDSEEEEKRRAFAELDKQLGQFVYRSVAWHVVDPLDVHTPVTARVLYLVSASHHEAIDRSMEIALSYQGTLLNTFTNPEPVASDEWLDEEDGGVFYDDGSPYPGLREHLARRERARLAREAADSHEPDSSKPASIEPYRSKA